MEVSDFLLANWRLVPKRDNFIVGWDRQTKNLWPTLTKERPDQAWGFSAMVGTDVGDNSALWSGVVAYRHDKGLWMRIASIREGSPADLAGLKNRDLIKRINGQIVFNLSVKDVDRLIRSSGDTLLLDVERDSARSSLYGSGTHATPLNYLYNDFKPEDLWQSTSFSRLL